MKIERKRGIKRVRIIHNRKLLWIIIVLIVIFIGLIYFIVQNKNQEKNPKPLLDKECEKDSDCIKVQTGCCSCDMGGEEKCVSISQKEKYNELLRKCGQRTVCIAMYACNIQSCRCVDNKCISK